MLKVHKLDEVLDVADKVLGNYNYKLQGTKIVFTIFGKNGIGHADITIQTSPTMNIKGLEKQMRRQKDSAMDKVTKYARVMKMQIFQQPSINSDSIYIN